MGPGSMTVLQSSIDQIAARIALNDSGNCQDGIVASLTALAALAASEGRDDIAHKASAICVSLQNPLMTQQQAMAQITAGIESLQNALNQVNEPPAQTGLEAISQDPELLSEFIHEAREHLQSIEVHLLAVEEERNAGEAIHAIFRSFHTIKGLAGFLELPLIQEVAHETENLLDQVRQGSCELTSARVDVVLESRDYIAAWLNFLEATPAGQQPAALTANAALLSRISILSQGGDEPSAAAAAAVNTTPAPEESVSATEKQRGRFIKVDTDKLDYLVDMVGEVVIAQSLIRHSPELMALHDTPVGRNLAQLARITEEVQRTAMAMRMVPIGPLFQKMARLVRDLGRKSGKPIAFETAGEDVELDRNIVEELADPVMHMIRNAADHGIESPEARTAAGKNPKGRIGLRAFHRSAQIVIEISDDGGGLRRERILAKAREKGLIEQQAVPNDADCLNLIFHPGFSTAEKVSDISGRGVGMDVVRKQIQRLRGGIDIHSVEGEGTTFSLRLPLTLAIIDGLIVAVGSERYVIPLASVKEMLRPTEGMVTTVEGRAEIVSIRDRLYPLVRLHARFGIQPRSTDPTEAVLVVAEADDVAFCLMVDDLIGKQEVVIKGLGPLFQHVAGVAGGAILGDGQVGLILDLNGIFGGRPGV